MTFKKGAVNVTSSTVTRSQSGRVTTSTVDGWTDTYSYDTAGRLCTAQVSTVKTINYRYGGTANCQVVTSGPGANGNRTTVDETTSGGGGGGLSRVTVGAWGVQNTTTTTGFTTAAFTPPANSLLVVAVAFETDGTATTAPAITLTNTGGLVFTKRAERLEPTAWAQGVAIFTAPVGASPVAMTVAVSNTAIATVGWQVRADAYSGYDTTIPIGASGAASALNNAGAGYSLPLSAATAATSETYAVLGGDEDAPQPPPVTPGSGWAEQYESGSLDPNLEIETKTGSLTVVPWTTIGSAGTAKAVAVAVEVRQAPGGGGGTTSTSYTYDAADRVTAVTGQAAPTYDGHGNTLTIGGQTFGWDGADRNLTITAGATTVSYQRDAADRIVARTDTGVTTRYAHTGPGDTADITLDGANTVIERVLPLPGGVTLTRRAAVDVWSFPNIHGDIVATSDATGASTGGPYRYDPYGQPLTTTGTVNTQAVPDTTQGNIDNAWLGQHQRPYEHAGTLAITQMGARPYSAGLARFLAVDPVEGGTTNDYTYLNDPANSFDLDGHCGVWGSPFKKCKETRKGQRGFMWGAFSKPYRHVTVGYGGCYLYCGDIKFQGGRVTVSAQCCGVMAKGPYVGIAGERASDRSTCSAFVEGAYYGGGQVSIGLRNGNPNPSDWEASGFPGMGAAFGIGCGVGRQVPGLPK